MNIKMSNHEDTPLFRQRHTLAHVLAEAIQRVQQWDVEVAIWPAIDNGLYYDFLFSEEKQIWEDDLKKVQDQMVKIVKENQEMIVKALSVSGLPKSTQELLISWEIKKICKPYIFKGLQT